MHYRLRTLLAIMFLSAVVSAGFAIGVSQGLVTYIACLSLFMASWRVRLVCERHDLRPFAWVDSWLPWEILLEAFWISLAAFGVFWLSNAFLLAVFLQTNARLSVTWFTVPLATLAALAVFWLSWPQQADCPSQY